MTTKKENSNYKLQQGPVAEYISSDLELALLRFLNKERWNPGQRECVKRLMTRNEMFFRTTEPHVAVEKTL